MEVTADGDQQRGPRLLDLLAASGVEGWSGLMVRGKGEGRAFDAELELRLAGVDRDWSLDISRRGTLKIESPALARERRVRDVTEIEVLE